MALQRNTMIVVQANSSSQPRE